MANNIAKVTVEMDVKQVVATEAKRMDAAAGEMAIDILNRAIMNAPKDTGALVRSGRLNKDGTASYTVSFGDNRVRYARKREYENKKNPHTIHYLKNAVESVQRGNINKYFR